MLARLPSVLSRLLISGILGVLLTAASEAGAQTISYLSLLDAVGVGLQSATQKARLSDGQHGGVFVTIAVDDSTLALVAPNATTPGSKSIDVFLPNGSTDASFVLQAIEGGGGIVTLTASAPGFTDAVDTVDLLVPIVELSGVLTAVDVPDVDDLFRVRVGLLNVSGSGIGPLQSVRFGGPGLIATVSSSDGAVAELVTDTVRGGSVNVAIAGGSSQSPATVASGGVALDGLTAGTTTVSVTAPGFDPAPSASVDVTVSPAAITLEDLPFEVGAGLESSGLDARLNGQEHGGVTVTIASTDDTKLLVSAGTQDPGQSSIDVFVPNGSTAARFYAHGIEGASGIVAVTASAPGFGNDSDAVTVVTPYFQIISLVTTIDVLDLADAFQVRVGLPNAGATTISTPQATRPGGPGLQVMLTSSDPTVGLLTTSSATNDTVAVFLPPDSSTTPSSVALGGVAFDGVGLGTATVIAQIPGFIPTTTAVRDVTVTQPGMTLSPSAEVGAGLRTSSQFVFLDATGHGGVNVHLEVDDPALGLISEEMEDVGVGVLDLFVANGSNSASFYIHGVENQVGTLHLTATAPGFTSDADSIDVVQPGLRLTGLSPSQDTFDVPNAFRAQVGVPNSAGTTITPQSVRPGSAGVTVNLSVSPANFATLQSLADTTDVATVIIPALSTLSPQNVASGGVALDGLAPGSVDLAFDASGFVSIPSSPTTVTITSPTMTASLVTEIGAGLQSGQSFVFLNATAHGGVTVHIESQDPSRLILSADSSVEGQAALDVFVADGGNSAAFYAQAIDGTLGPVTIDASVPGFNPVQFATEVAQPAVEIVFLGTSHDVSDPDDPFVVRVGLPNSIGSSVSPLQSRRGGQPPLVATLTSSEPTSGELVTLGTTGASANTTVAGGSSSSPSNVASGGVAFRSVGAGSPLITASIPGFFQTGRANVLVNVTSDGVALPAVPAALGSGLQVGPLVAQLGDGSHGGVNLQLASDDPATMLISDHPDSLGGASQDFFLPNGQTTASYYLQAIEGTSGTVGLTASAAGFANGMVSVLVEMPALQISLLADSLDVNAPDDPFVVQVGIADADDASLAQLQTVRPFGTPPTITLSQSDPSLAQLVTNAGQGDDAVITIAAGQVQSGSTLGTGGVALNPILPGQTVLTANAPGYLTTLTGSHAVLITGIPTAIDLVPARKLALAQNEPNPFNPSTTIRFELPTVQRVELEIYDLAGRSVARLVDGQLGPGPHERTWSGKDAGGDTVASGVYIYLLRAGDKTMARKMVLLK